MEVSRTTYTRITPVLASSLGVEELDITPCARLQEDLGAESIDFLDIVFRLEGASSGSTSLAVSSSGIRPSTTTQSS